jgi:hypothetical protein
MFVHYQTYIATAPVVNNWNNFIVGSGLAYNTAIYDSGQIPPVINAKVGSYFAQSLATTARQSFIYTNSVPVTTWSTYTAEGWVNLLSSTATNSRKLVWGPVTLTITASTGVSQFSYTGTATNIGSSFTIPVGWTYITLVKTSNTNRVLYVNGTAVQTITTSYDDNSFNATIVSFSDDSLTTSQTGLLYDQVRISTVARYTTNFTPPTTAFTNDSSTWFLCNWENTWQPANQV